MAIALLNNQLVSSITLNGGGADTDTEHLIFDKGQLYNTDKFQLSVTKGTIVGDDYVFDPTQYSEPIDKVTGFVFNTTNAMKETPHYILMEFEKDEGTSQYQMGLCTRGSNVYDVVVGGESGGRWNYYDGTFTNTDTCKVIINVPENGSAFYSFNDGVAVRVKRISYLTTEFFRAI